MITVPNYGTSEGAKKGWESRRGAMKAKGTTRVDHIKASAEAHAAASAKSSPKVYIGSPKETQKIDLPAPTRGPKLEIPSPKSTQKVELPTPTRGPKLEIPSTTSSQKVDLPAPTPSPRDAKTAKHQGVYDRVRDGKASVEDVKSFKSAKAYFDKNPGEFRKNFAQKPSIGRTAPSPGALKISLPKFSKK